MRLGSTARVRLVVVAAVVALVAAGCMPADPGWTGPASGGTTFSTPGTTTFIVPPGVCAVSIAAEGGHGGAGFDTTAAGPGSAGGAGARVSVHVAAFPGTPFLVVVGGAGADATATSRGTGGAAGGAAGGGIPSPPVTSTSTSTTSTTGVPVTANTGGGGGGASVVSYGTPLVVAGGGGGGGGGHAGSGGAAGPLGSPGVAGEHGGGGGTVAGGGGAGGVGAGSGGSTSLAGGTGSGDGGGGGAGGTGFGGGGGGAELGGGGGGAGWGGGGGGAADGGGGGGSSTVALGATNVSSAPSGRNGAGQVIVSWDGIGDSCPVTAPVGHVPPLARSGSSARPLVAISIDDLWGASGARDVNATMDVLASRNVKGVTFFPTGGALEQHAGLGYSWVWRKVARSGSEIGNHTYTHSQLPTVSDLGIWWEMQHTQDLLNQMLGQGFAYQMHLMRPPGGAGGYGYGDPRILGIVNSMGLSMVMWTIETHGSGPTHGAFVSSIIRNAVPGSIILLHFTQITPNEIGTLIDGLRAKGLEPTTVTSLFP